MPGKSNTFDPNLDVPYLHDKVHAVTGCSAGTGFAPRAPLLQYIPERISSEAWKTSTSRSQQDPREVRRHPAHIPATIRPRVPDSDHPRLEALILNAGFGVANLSQTVADGLERHTQVNNALGHSSAWPWRWFPPLRATPDSRLGLYSSELKVNADAGPTVLYNRSKLAGQLGLAPGEAHWMIEMDPGAMSTDQAEQQAVEAYGEMAKAGVAAVHPFMKDPVEEGCRSALFTATIRRAGEEQIDGAYVVPDCKATEPSIQAKAEEQQERLWNLAVDVWKGRLGDLPHQRSRA